MPTAGECGLRMLRAGARARRTDIVFVDDVERACRSWAASSEALTPPMLISPLAARSAFCGQMAGSSALASSGTVSQSGARAKMATSEDLTEENEWESHCAASEPGLVPEASKQTTPPTVGEVPQIRARTARPQRIGYGAQLPRVASVSSVDARDRAAARRTVTLSGATSKSATSTPSGRYCGEADAERLGSDDVSSKIAEVEVAPAGGDLRRRVGVTSTSSPAASSSAGRPVPDGEAEEASWIPRS